MSSENKQWGSIEKCAKAGQETQKKDWFYWKCEKGKEKKIIIHGTSGRGEITEPMKTIEKHGRLCWDS